MDPSQSEDKDRGSAAAACDTARYVGRIAEQRFLAYVLSMVEQGAAATVKRLSDR